jgi:hypothetical protein
LEWDIDNYRVSCPKCNTKKGNKFKRKERIATNKSQLSKEIPYFLDPCCVGDSDLLIYDHAQNKFTYIHSCEEDSFKKDRVLETISGYGLDRKELEIRITNILHRFSNLLNLYLKTQNPLIKENIILALESKEYYSVKKIMLYERLYGTLYLDEFQNILNEIDRCFDPSIKEVKRELPEELELF